MNDNSKLVKAVTSDTEGMYQTLDKMISPGKFLRIVGVEEFSHFFANNLKERLLNLHLSHPTKLIIDYHPSKINIA